MQSKLVFVHGAGEISEVWYYQVRKFPFSDAVSLPGHPQGEGCLSIEEYAQWLERYIRERNYENVVLIGHSAGGAIALTCVLKKPYKYKGLVLIGTGAKFRPLDETIEFIKRALDGDDSEWRKSFEEKYWMVDFRLKADLIKKRVSLGPKVQINDLLCCSKFDARNLLNKIKLPVLLICGNDDNQTPPAYSEYLAENIEKSMLLIIENATHQVMLERSKQVNRAIEKFITEIELDVEHS